MVSINLLAVENGPELIVIGLDVSSTKWSCPERGLKVEKGKTRQK
jgi:hypothetical protein